MSDALALFGDWNGTPRDRGRWSPDWVADRAGLTIRSAGPGRHGDIDYPMADTRLRDLDRHPPPGLPRHASDHDVVVATLSPPNKTTTAVVDAGDSVSVRREQLRVGTWNVLYGRDPRLVAGQVLRVLHQYRLDVLCLQEAADYHRQLANLPGYRLVAYEGKGKGHNVILVREGLRTRRPKLVQLSPRGWRIVTGGTHAPLYAPSVVVEWCRIVCLHLPPSVNWTRRGIIHGPPLRVAAYVAAARRLVRWARANRRSRDN